MSPRAEHRAYMDLPEGESPGRYDEDDLIQCPGCELRLPEGDFPAQIAHMESDHPDIVAARRAEAARFDGWEQD